MSLVILKHVSYLALKLRVLDNVPKTGFNVPLQLPLAQNISSHSMPQSDISLTATGATSGCTVVLDLEPTGTRGESGGPLASGSRVHYDDDNSMLSSVDSQNESEDYEAETTNADSSGWLLIPEGSEPQTNNQRIWNGLQLVNGNVLTDLLYDFNQDRGQG